MEIRIQSSSFFYEKKEMDRTCNYKVERWDMEDAKEGLEFYCYGRTKDGKSVCTRIEEFCPYTYIQLPKKKKISWGKREERLLFEYLKERVCVRSGPPVSFTREKKFFLKGKIPVDTLKLEFRTLSAMRACAKAMETRQHRIDGVGIFEAKELRTHEQNIDTYTKFFTHRSINSTGWISVKEKAGKAYQKFSKADIEFSCFWKHVAPGDDEGLVSTKKLSFDIEAYSKNHSAFPDPNMKENVVTHVAWTVSDLDGTIFKEVLSLGDCLRIPGVLVRNYPTEKRLLAAMIERISEIDPDIIIGYNSLKFDWNYLMIRIKKCGLFQRLCTTLTRIFAVPASEDKMSWKSSAYGTQEFKFLKIPGVSQIDMYIEFERNEKLDKNTLDFVAEKFLGERKKDVSAKELFKVMEISMALEKRGKLGFREMRRALYTSINRKHSTKYLLGFRQKIKSCKNFKALDLLVRGGVTKLADYCVQDTVLPLRLLEKRDVVLNMDMLASVFCVPREYLQTRGQQVKVFSRLYRELQKDNVIVEFRGYDREASNVKFKGATVFDAKIGLWEDILVWDFESLYPSEIISNNIDYTSFCTNDETVPDSDCNVIEWDQHEFCGCPLDSKAGKKKKKDEEVVCGHFVQRFKKSRVLDDGTVEEGVLPRMLRGVLTQRKVVKKMMSDAQKLADAETDPEKKKELTAKVKVFNSTQLALKIAANSGYGALGATQGLAPLVEAAAAVTTAGRQDIQKVVQMILERWPEGTLVYGDTDSCMIHYPGKTPKELIEFGEMVGKEISKHLVAPMNLQFEKLCKDFLLFSKKRYYTLIVDKSGKVIATDKKGIILTRRDNCLLARDLFGETVTSIIAKKPQQEILQNVLDRIYLMMARALPDQKYVITKSIKALDEYKNEGKSLSNVALAKKMQSRGEEVIPNTRLEFVFLEVPGAKKGDKILQTEQIEDFTWYLDNKKRLGLRIDTDLYLDKKLMKPIEELLDVWEKQTVPYEKLCEKIKRLEGEVSEGDKDVVELLRNLFRKRNMDEFIPQKGQKTMDEFVQKKKDIKIQTLLERAMEICKMALNTDKSVLVQLVLSYNREKHIKTLNARRKMFGLPAVRQRLPKRKSDVLVQNDKLLRNLGRAHLAHSETAKRIKKLFAKPVVE
ncbi:DNA polymerase delta catalytic subunit [Cannes 8 virus]|nr:DNA polymerase delta catalytic subunit [Cannes 8 virus]